MFETRVFRVTLFYLAIFLNLVMAYCGVTLIVRGIASCPVCPSIRLHLPVVLSFR